MALRCGKSRRRPRMEARRRRGWPQAAEHEGFVLTGVCSRPKTKQATHCASPVFRPLLNRVAISADWLGGGPQRCFHTFSSLSPFFFGGLLPLWGGLSLGRLLGSLPALRSLALLGRLLGGLLALRGGLALL